MVLKRTWIYRDKYCIYPHGALLVTARTKRGALKRIKQEIELDGYKRNLSKEDLEPFDEVLYVRYIEGFIG